VSDKNPMHPIRDVYERFAHLDDLLSNDLQRGNTTITQARFVWPPLTSGRQLNRRSRWITRPPRLRKGKTRESYSHTEFPRST